jgi:antirestriction protein ArdC
VGQFPQICILNSVFQTLVSRNEIHVSYRTCFFDRVMILLKQEVRNVDKRTLYAREEEAVYLATQVICKTNGIVNHVAVKAQNLDRKRVFF